MSVKVGRARRGRAADCREKAGGQQATHSVPFHAAKDIPDVFALKVAQDLVGADIKTGDEAVFSRRVPAVRGDVAVLILRPELVKAGDCQCFIRRLALAIPPGVTFPHKVTPGSTAHFVVMVEAPGLDLASAVKCSDLLDVVRFSHVQWRAAQ